MDVDFRDCRPEELTTAAGVWRRAEAARTGVEPSDAGGVFLDDLAQAVTRPGARLLVGIAGQEIVATVYGVPLRSDAGKAQVAMLGVEPRLWGQGLGGQMLSALTEALQQQGCRYLRMNVDPANHRARALYERHGWQHSGETERVGDAEELIYRRDLGSARPIVGA